MSDHPITPTPELVKEWIRDANHNEPMFTQVAILGAQWGADRELEACCQVLETMLPNLGTLPLALRAARRPKPPVPSLAQPEPEFTAEEVEMIQAPWSYLAPAQPEPVGPTDQEIDQIYWDESWRGAAEDQSAVNEVGLEEFRLIARAVLQRWGRPTSP